MRFIVWSSYQNKIWISKEKNNFSYLWKFEHDIGKKLSLKNLTLSKNVCLIDVFATPKIYQFSIAAISFAVACNGLKITQIVNFWI